MTGTTLSPAISSSTDIDVRARTIVERMTVAERVGLLFHPMIFVGSPVEVDQPSPLGPSLRELIVERGIRYFCLGAIPPVAHVREALDDLQALARSTGSRLPIVFSTDPRHSFVQNDGASHRADGVSQWPEPIGLGAIGDEDLVRRFGEVVRADYRALGIQMALHPQIDLATEPRWARQAQSFGADPEHSARLVRAYLEGLQGAQLGPESIAATTKHFPGGGPQKDGEDPHFVYGREQVYPGGRFEDHLVPFRAAIEAGTAAIMPYYGMPVGLDLHGERIEEVGFAFNRQLITGLLRERLGFDGVVLSDFGLVTDATVFGKPFPARAWGVEHLSPIERVRRLFDAGVDQLGGENDPALVLELIDRGEIDTARVDASATRLVRLQLQLGLLDEPDGDGRAKAEGDAAAGGADGFVASPEHIALGIRAQSQAMTVLAEREGILPLGPELRVHLRDLAPAAAPAGWQVVAPEDAEIAVVRVGAPFEPRDTYFLESSMEQGSLAFDTTVVDGIRALAERMPVVLVVTLSRPAILTPLADTVAALVGDFGAGDAAVIAALTGEVEPVGRLPFELPRSMDAVRRSSPDVPSDTEDPLFPIGWSARGGSVRS
ncbi:glycoside hydrolase family 3 protein [Microbacterium aurantiacum]|uniref:glycoside hydrolase family 3 protein n=1 Tax=Microbacterium aurantiacum TaxID=162393 RepID=UPI003F49273F